MEVNAPYLRTEEMGQRQFTLLTKLSRVTDILFLLVPLIIPSIYMDTPEGHVAGHDFNLVGCTYLHDLASGIPLLRNLPGYPLRQVITCITLHVLASFCVTI